MLICTCISNGRAANLICLSEVRFFSGTPEGRFNSCSLIEDRREGSPVRFRMICVQDNIPVLTQGETNDPGGQPVKAVAESAAGANVSCVAQLAERQSQKDICCRFSVRS